MAEVNENPCRESDTMIIKRQIVLLYYEFNLGYFLRDKLRQYEPVWLIRLHSLHTS